ncbi:MAG: DUF2459 domain-containing protein [Proteobacteria bacterium]|nr:DUF2459 domain-containing protein [Pseudomonadota bacterium]
MTMRGAGVLLGTLFLAACAARPVAVTDPPAGAGATVYVVARGWHTDIGLDAALLDRRWDALRARFPGATMFVVGFGERAYLQKPNHTPLDALAALLPNDGLLLVTALVAPPEAAFSDDEVIPVAVSPAGFAAVASYVRASMRNGPDGAPEPVGGGPYPGSAFYAATPTYSALFTCNTWTADGLRTGGVPIETAAMFFSSQVTGQLDWRTAR